MPGTFCCDPCLAGLKTNKAKPQGAKTKAEEKVYNEKLVGELPTILRGEDPEQGYLPAMMESGKDHPILGASRLFYDQWQDTGVNTASANMFGAKMTVTSDPDAAKDVIEGDPQRFTKNWDNFPVMEHLRPIFGRGLFFTPTDSPEWGIAHRILQKPFSRMGMKSFCPAMNEQANKLVECLKREVGFGGVSRLDKWVTKMAFETIAVCGLGTSFNSFDSDEVDPFLIALGHVVRIAVGLLVSGQSEELETLKEQGQVLRDTCADIIKKRRGGKSQADGNMPDLLDLMLTEACPLTGQKFTDEMIIDNVLTFLFAGQDSTAQALSSFFTMLAANPAAEAELILEIQNVCGNGDVKWEHVPRLVYLDYCVKETLRVLPPLTGIVRAPVGGAQPMGKWHVRSDHEAMVGVLGLHYSTDIWGPDVAEFKPERWAKGCPHKYGYLPFSSGPRACIGREFTILEQKITVVKLMQNFIFKRPAKVTPPEGYSQVKGAEPCLPIDLGIDHEYSQATGFVAASSEFKFFKRPQSTTAPQPFARSSTMMQIETAAAAPIAKWECPDGRRGHNTKLLVLAGSNGGSTGGFAESFTRHVSGLCFESHLETLNDFKHSGRMHEPCLFDCVVILSATYNGEPPDDADEFVTWLKEEVPKHQTPLSGMTYTVLGCGNTEWQATYQAVPILIDEHMHDLGAQRLLPRHEANSAQDPDADYELWEDEVIAALNEKYKIGLQRSEGTAPQLEIPSVQVLSSSTDVPPLTLGYEFTAARQMSVVTNAELRKSAGGGASCRHVEIELPAGVVYKAGDHFAVYPENDMNLVKALCEKIGMLPSAVVELEASSLGTTPKAAQRGPLKRSLSMAMSNGKQVRLEEWLARAVDLSKRASSKVIKYLASRAGNGADKLKLEDPSIKELKMPLLEILQAFPSVRVGLAEVLALLPAMKPRLYSISSSPLASPSHVSLCFTVVSGPSPTGRIHNGVCTSFLKSRSKGALIWGEVRDTGASFRLPSPPTCPLLMVGAGSGVAPLRGFLQELQQLRAQGLETNDVQLFFGCRTPDDFLFERELRAFEADGTLTKLHVAFSRHDKKEYVQHLMVSEADSVWKILGNGGHLFVCGDASGMSPGVRKAVKSVAHSAGGLTMTSAEKWFEQVSGAHDENKRYHEDVWAGDA